MVNIKQQVCLSDINADLGEETLVELREQFGKDKVAFIRFDVNVIVIIVIMKCALCRHWPHCHRLCHHHDLGVT